MSSKDNLELRKSQVMTLFKQNVRVRKKVMNFLKIFPVLTPTQLMNIQNCWKTAECTLPTEPNLKREKLQDFPVSDNLRVRISGEIKS